MRRHLPSYLLVACLSSHGCLADGTSRYVAHAGETLGGGFTMSNSLEALERSYADGRRLFEVDFNWTPEHEFQEWFEIAAMADLGQRAHSLPDAGKGALKSDEPFKALVSCTSVDHES